MMTRTQAIQAAVNVDGWTKPEELGRLYDLAFRAVGPIVEIGSHWGRSTVALALGSMAGSKQPVYAVDSFVGVPAEDRPTDKDGKRPGEGSSSQAQLEATLINNGCRDIVIIMAMTSEQALPYLPAPGLVFVDGGHEYPDVSQDLKLYLPFIIPGGSVICHDVAESDPGVVRAVAINGPGRNNGNGPQRTDDAA